jgi:hypothetical protein
MLREQMCLDLAHFLSKELPLAVGIFVGRVCRGCYVMVVCVCMCVRVFFILNMMMGG